MNFKEFIFTEEINPDDTATVYHRTHYESTVSDILKSGFQPGASIGGAETAGAGDYYGKGLYTTISLENQFNRGMLTAYGSIIVKFHVTNLDKYLIFHPGIARRIHGQNSYKLSDQLKKFGLDHKFKPDYLSHLDNELDRPQKGWFFKYEGINPKDFYEQNKWIQNDPAIKGMIFFDSHGYNLLKYEPVNDGTITMLAYAKVEDTSPEMMQKLYNNEGWITSTDKAKIKQIEQLPYDQRSSYAQISKLNFKTPVQLYKFLIRNHLDLSQLDTGIEVIINILQEKSPLNDKIIDFLINRSSSDTNVRDLLRHASEKQEMAKLIIKNKKELSDKDVRNLLDFASDKQEILKLIIQNKKELSDDNVYQLLYYASDKQEMAKFIIQNKKELKKELSNDNIHSLLHYASDKKEIASILGSININKLSDNYVRELIVYASDKQEMANILGSININKLNDENISRLFTSLMFSTQTPAQKRSAEKEIAQIIDQYHTRKTPEIQELIKPYLQQNT